MELLDNPVQPYAWGSPTAIPELLGLPVTGEPVAELWLGGHPVAPSRLLRSVDRAEAGARAAPARDEAGPGGGGREEGGHLEGPATDLGVRLDEALAANPAELLGAGVVERFGARLPFLLKVLAVARPLSLQVHPSAERARQGFAAEEAAGIPLDDGARNYRDDQHKPELVVALEPFHALIGFRPVPETLDLLQTLRAGMTESDRVLPEVAAPERAFNGIAPPETGAGDVLRRLMTALGARPDGDGLRALTASLLRTPETERERLVAEIRLACDRALVGGSPYDIEFSTIRDLAQAYPGDPGVVVALLMNRRRLEPGQGVFVPAGLLHAYLSGVAVEIMASSDNTLRGGLTPKHVDIPELLEVLDVEATVAEFPPVVEPGRVVTYDPPVEEFILHFARPVGERISLPGGGPRLLLCLDGEVGVHGRSGRLELARGQGAFAPASEGELQVYGVGTLLSAGPGRIVAVGEDRS